MSGKRWLGAAILAAVFVGMFVGTAIGVGWLEALKLWGYSLALTAVVILGCWLLAGDDE